MALEFRFIETQILKVAEAYCNIIRNSFTASRFLQIFESIQDVSDPPDILLVCPVGCSQGYQLGVHHTTTSSLTTHQINPQTGHVNALLTNN
jgi:hypothetical protein